MALTGFSAEDGRALLESEQSFERHAVAHEVGGLVRLWGRIATNFRSMVEGHEGALEVDRFVRWTERVEDLFARSRMSP